MKQFRPGLAYKIKLGLSFFQKDTILHIP
jgi:hypothetical protein